MTDIWVVAQWGDDGKLHILESEGYWLSYRDADFRAYELNAAIDRNLTREPYWTARPLSCQKG